MLLSYRCRKVAQISVFSLPLTAACRLPQAVTFLYQVPGTRYLVPGTWYQVIGTKYLVPSTWYQVLGTKHLVPSTWYQVLGPGTWYQVLGTKYLVQVLGTKYLVPGAWYRKVTACVKRQAAISGKLKSLIWATLLDKTR